MLLRIFFDLFIQNSLFFFIFTNQLLFFFFILTNLLLFFFFKHITHLFFLLYKTYSQIVYRIFTNNISEFILYIRWHAFKIFNNLFNSYWFNFPYFMFIAFTTNITSSVILLNKI